MQSPRSKSQTQTGFVQLKRFWNSIPQFLPSSKDFVIFEFGWQRLYLLWRAGSLVLLTTLMFGMPSFSFPESLLDLKYMHGWLMWLLLLSLIMETVTLGFIFLLYEPWQLSGYEEDLPVIMKIIWSQYALIYPNIFSCAFMYATFFHDFTYDVVKKRILQYTVTFFAAVHILTTAITSRLYHVIMPLILTVIFIGFSALWQAELFSAEASDDFQIPYVEESDNRTVPIPGIEGVPEVGGAALSFFAKHKDALYEGMNWKENWFTALLVALCWIVCTACCHIIIVIVAWKRRAYYYDLRKSHDKPATVPSAIPSSIRQISEERMNKVEPLSSTSVNVDSKTKLLQAGKVKDTPSKGPLKETSKAASKEASKTSGLNKTGDDPSKQTGGLSSYLPW